ncbi:MAG: signal transduction histidine kinase/ligand-binding sensor domain-containing protein [Phenylobacterium sp.]|jgi:signal transduction histidine kinase/ligand-binding sensor domain-containing protein
MRLMIILLILLSAFVPEVLGSSAPVTRFDRLSVEHGLSQASVLDIVQDHKGFLWFATQDGLNRYDGYSFKVFRHNPDDPHSISDNSINTLFIDSTGLLWIGTLGGGLNRYDANTGQFVHFKHDSATRNSLSHNNVLAIVEDTAGDLWLGTLAGLNRFTPSSGQFEHFLANNRVSDNLSDNHILSLHSDSKGTLWVGTNNGLNRFNPQQQTFSHYIHHPADQHSLSHNSVNAILEDSAGFLWLGTSDGLNRLDTISNSSENSHLNKAHFTQFKHHQSDPHSLSDNNIQRLFQDSNGTLWVGTQGGGLNRFNSTRGDFVHYDYQPHDPNSLSDNTVRSIFEDQQGGLWIGSFVAGVSKITPQRQHFGHVKHQPTDPNSLSHNLTMAFNKDASGALWIGTHDGLNKLLSHTTAEQTDTVRFSHFKHQAGNPHSLSHNSVWAIEHDNNDSLWLGTLGGGLNRYNPVTKQFSHFKHSSSNPNSLSDNDVVTLFIDSQQTLWIGTWGGGLNRYNPATNNFSRFNHNPALPNSLSHNEVNSIIEDNRGNLWVGTYGGGLNRFDANTQEFVSYQHQSSNPNSLSHNAVYSLYVDSKDNLWVGTAAGLNRFISQSNHFIQYREKHGLANGVINAILEDDQGLLWLSTNKGLSRFNPNTESFKNYDVNDGLQSNEFNFGSRFKNDKGELFFGGINGYNRFLPDNIQDDQQPPTVVLTDFLLANRSVPVQSSAKHLTSESPFNLSKTIDNLDSLTLTYQQNLIGFEFTALHFTNPMKNQYAYKLEGQDQDWVYTSANKRFATYTNLAPGNYILRVKASNHHGYWNEQGKSLKITVLPPPWKTWWACSLYILLLLTLLAAFVRSQQNKIRAGLALNQRLTEVDKLKDEFLANTSHELRTPLNGIIGLAESLMDGVAGPLPDSANHNLAMVVASGRRLANLVNDILDFSQLKNRNMALVTQPVDLYSLVEVVLALSRPLLGNKSLQLINAINQYLPAAKADENRLAQILHNLVGNAIKFSDAGTVTVSAQVTDHLLTISVSDTGIGIEASQFDTIFASFEQLKNDTGASGTGLGLAVSKQLVELHGGTLWLESQPNKGSTFYFTLPVSHQSGATLSAVNVTNTQMVSRLHMLEENQSSANKSQPQASTQTDPLLKDHQFRILLVDDEPVNRQVLKNLLSLQNYQLVEADGGAQALAALRDDGPFDLVLLDIMMPKISGYEVCRQLREDHAMNDLPVIFLTAKNQVSDLVESFAMGGNDYLTKPVTKHELLARVATHLTLLDINRNLDRKVNERTADLVQMANQKQLAEAEKLTALGTLTAGVAHEINNPANFVGVAAHNLGIDLKRFEQFLFNLLGDDPDEEIVSSFHKRLTPLYQQLETIGDGTERIKIIAQDLRTFTQPDAAERKTINIAKKLQSTLNLVKVQYIETIEFITEFDLDPQLSCYPAQLNQVFMNLVVNACDAIAEKQQSQVPGQPMQGTIVIGCHEIDNVIEIVVKDNGNGMSEETKTRLFEQFYTTKGAGKGTGLGLSISYGIVQKHGGELSVESQLGQGSKFLIRLPT